MEKSMDAGRTYYEQPHLWKEKYWTDVQLQRAQQTAALLPAAVSWVLDIGCGAGVVTQELKRRFGGVVGLDFAFEPLRQVQGADLTAIQGDGSRLPFSAGAFEAVVATEIIEHLSASARRQALAEMARVSRRYILISVPYHEVLEISQVKCSDCGCIFHAYRHTASFTEATMQSLLTPLPFRLSRTETLGHKSKRLPRWSVMLAQIFGCYKRVEPGWFICPQCGNNDHPIKVPRWMRRLLLGLPYRLFPWPRRSTWIVGLYERQAE